MAVIDGDGEWSGTGQLVVHWSALGLAAGQMSLPQQAEQMGTRIRGEYLAWSSRMRSLCAPGTPTGERLLISRLGSFWFWPMTLLAEKSPMKSPALHDIFKLRALEIIYVEASCMGLVYRGNDRKLARVLRNWCGTMGHPFEHHDGGRPKGAGLRGAYAALPYLLQGLVFFAYRWCARILRGRRGAVKPWTARHAHQLTAVSTFPNVDLAQTRNGRFWSHNWQDLHRLLDELPLAVNWIWLYANSQQCTFAQALALRDRCNAAAPGKYRHFLLEDFLTPLAALARALPAFFELYRKARGIRWDAETFRMVGSCIDFFPLLEDDWRSSVQGKAAMESILFCCAFDALARRLPPQQSGLLYLWENQAWEHALLAVWRANQAGPTIGHQHSTVPALNLRFFPDRGEAEPVRQPALPDILAVNGKWAHELLAAAGVPKERMRVVTALRYPELAHSRHSLHKPLPASGRSLLVITGYLPAECAFQLRLLGAAARQGGLQAYGRILVKPHPYFSIESLWESSCPGLAAEILSTPLARLWPQADMVYCANSTSVIVEAAWLGLPLAVTGAGDAMNLNPLFAWPGVHFIYDAAALRRELEQPGRITLGEEVFCFDQLASWRELITRECLRPPAPSAGA